MDKSVFAKQLKNLRLKRKISQSELSKVLSVSQQTIGSWEVGRTEPSNQILENIADYFQVSTDYLLGRNETNNYANESPTVLMLRRASEEKGLSEEELSDIVSYAKFKYPNRFEGL